MKHIDLISETALFSMFSEESQSKPLSVIPAGCTLLVCPIDSTTEPAIVSDLQTMEDIFNHFQLRIKILITK